MSLKSGPNQRRPRQMNSAKSATSRSVRKGLTKDRPGKLDRSDDVKKTRVDQSKVGRGNSKPAARVKRDVKLNEEQDDASTPWIVRRIVPSNKQSAKTYGKCKFEPCTNIVDCKYKHACGFLGCKNVAQQTTKYCLDHSLIKRISPPELPCQKPKFAAAVAESIQSAKEELLGSVDAALQLWKDDIVAGDLEVEAKAYMPPREPPATEPEATLPSVDALDEDYDFEQLISSTKVECQPWDKFRDLVYAHYATSKSLDSADVAAKSRYPVWMNKAGIEVDDRSYRKALEIVSEISCENWNPFNTWKFYWARLKLNTISWIGANKLAWLAILLSYVLLWFAKPKLFYSILFVAITQLVRYYWSTRIVDELTVTKLEHLGDWCTEGSIVLETLYKIDKNWLKLPRFITDRWKCERRDYLVGFTIAEGRVWCPRNCFHNQYRCMVKRQLLPVIDPVPYLLGNEKFLVTRQEAWTRNLKVFTNLFPCPELRYSGDHARMFETFILKYPLRMRDALRKQYNENRNGLYFVNSNSKNFVKVEFLPVKKAEKMDPRAISGKNFDYLVESAPEYYCLQKQLCKEVWNDPQELFDNRSKFIYTGGMTPDQIGLLVSLYETIGWHFSEGDFSRYDGHNEVEALQAEFDWYKLSHETKELLLRQLKTNGAFNSGIKVHHVGKVCSGVINTSLGNTIRGFMLFAGFFDTIGYQDYVVIQLGDDNIVITKDRLELAPLVDWATICGHKLEINNIDDVDKLQFCSSYFWQVQPGLRVLGPKPERVLAKTFISTDPNLRKDQLGSYVTQIAQGFKNYFWIPVLGEFCQKILDAKLTERTVKVKNNEFSIRLKEPIPVDKSLVRAQFYKLYGFAADAIDFTNWKPSLGTSLQHELLDAMLTAGDFKESL